MNHLKVFKQTWDFPVFIEFYHSTLRRGILSEKSGIRHKEVNGALLIGHEFEQRLDRGFRWGILLITNHIIFFSQIMFEILLLLEVQKVELGY